MSLQVWLPLTKDLRNQGLADVTVTNNGATFTNGGKLGEKYFSAGTITIPASSSNSIFNGTHMSFSFWLKPIGTSGTNIIFGQGNMSAGNNRMYSIFQYPTPNDLHISWQSEASNSPFIGFTISGFFEADKWTHCALIYDGSKLLVYKNGILNGTYNGVNTRTAFNYDYPINGSSIRCLNDFRIYNHTLSQKEISDLKNALILHYPLDNNGVGGENLLKNSNFLQGTNGMQGYTATMATCTKQTDCMKVVSTSASGGFYTSNFNSITTGDMTTFSADVKADSNMTIYIGTDGSENGSCQSYTIGTSWQRISISKAKTTNNASLRIYGNGTFYTKNLKYELGSKPTPWCPNKNDALYTSLGYNDGIEYDTSGFGNNGTRVGEFSWSTDTPRYNVSQVFSGNQYIVEPNEINTIDSTIALWIKSALSGGAHILDARNSSQVGKQPIYQRNDGSIQTGGSSAYVISNSGLLVADTWVHVALVQSGNSLLIYKNGSLFQTISCTNSPLIKPTLGARLNFINKYTGQLSDFRIYATALSADDILSLYQASAYIDSQGNTYASSYVEG